MKYTLNILNAHNSLFMLPSLREKEDWENLKRSDKTLHIYIVS